MKRIVLIFVVLMVANATTGLFAQVPPPPPQDHGSIGNKSSGGGAPIGGGLFILLGLGAAYGGKKLYNMGKDKLEE